MLITLLACAVSDDKAIDTAYEENSSPAPELIWRSIDGGVGTGGAWLDIDNDGDFDIVVSDGNDILPGHLRLYLNESGRLSETANWVSDQRAFYGHLSVGDINLDGWVDVVVSRYIGSADFMTPGGVDVYLNSGGQLVDEPSQSIDGYFTFSNALGDVDMDGDLDLAIAVGEGYYHGPMHSIVLENNQGDFASSLWEDSVAGTSYDVEFIDADRDMDLDLVVLDSGAPHRVIENINGQLAEAKWWLGDSLNAGNSIALADINGDGAADVIASETAQLDGIPAVRGWCSPGFEQCWHSEAPERYPSAVTTRLNDGGVELFVGAWWGELQRYRLGASIGQPQSTISNSEWVVEQLSWGSLTQTFFAPASEWSFLTANCSGSGQRSRHYFSEHSDLNCASELEILITDWTEGAGSQLIYWP